MGKLLTMVGINEHRKYRMLSPIPEKEELEEEENEDHVYERVRIEENIVPSSNLN